MTRSSAVGIGVVGYGYWGPNLVRNFSEHPEAHVVAVCDSKSDRLEAAARRHPGVGVTAAFSDLLESPEVDAIIVATPSATHFALARAALLAGKHVLMEKPMTSTSEEAEILIELAERRRLVLMVDHTFCYTPAVQKLRSMVDQSELGQLYYWDSVRINLGLFQRDVGVLHDLAVHDLAIIDHVLGQTPVAVSATGVAHVKGRPVSTAYLTCYFANDFIAHIHVNWLSPIKLRRTLVSGDGGMVMYDEAEPTDKIRVYDSGITVLPTEDHHLEPQIQYRSGDILVPRLPGTEALGEEASHFLACIAGGSVPLTDGKAGWRVVRVLEAAQESLEAHGRPVEMSWPVPDSGHERARRPETAA